MEKVIDVRHLGQVWRGLRANLQGVTRVIPEDNQEINECPFKLVALQQTKTGRIVVTDSLREYGRQNQLNDYKVQKLRHGEKVNGWKVFKEKAKRENTVVSQIRILDEQGRGDYNQKIMEGQNNCFVHRNIHGKVDAVAWVRSAKSWVFKEFFKISGINIDINSKASIKQSRTKLTVKKYEKKDGVDGWVKDKKVDKMQSKPAKKTPPAKKTRKKQGEPDVIIWKAQSYSL